MSLLNTLYIWEHYNDLTNPLSLALSLNWTTWTMNGSGNDGYKVWLIPVIIILSLNVLHRKQHHTQHAAFLSNISPWWWLPIIVLHFILIQSFDFISVKYFWSVKEILWTTFIGIACSTVHNRIPNSSHIQFKIFADQNGANFI